MLNKSGVIYVYREVKSKKIKSTSMKFLTSAATFGAAMLAVMSIGAESPGNSSSALYHSTQQVDYVDDYSPSSLPGATVWGTKSLPSRTLVLYDTTGPWGYLGQMYAMAAGIWRQVADLLLLNPY